MSKCSKLVKLYDINNRSPVFLDTVYKGSKEDTQSDTDIWHTKTDL